MHQREGGFRNAFHVGQIRKAEAVRGFKQEAGCLHCSVNDWKRSGLKRAEEEAGADDAGVRLDVATVDVVLTKGPGEHVFQDGNAGSGAVEREAFRFSPAEGAQFVEADDVVEVWVGVDDRVDLRQLLAQRLLSKIRAGIHQDFTTPG